MTSRFFDVVVLGRSVGALCAAALLARRDFRVLVLGNGERPSRYRFEELEFARRTFSLLGASSPVFSRLLVELAQSPLFRRRLVALDPMLGMFLPDHWLELAPDLELFAREIEREFSGLRQVVEELYAQLATINGAVDQVFASNVVWPPQTWLERLLTGRAAARLPLLPRPSSSDLMARFPAGHPFRQVVTVPALFASDLSLGDDALPPLSLARLHGTWTRGMQALPGGEAEFEAFMVERIEADGGVCRLDAKAQSLALRRGRVVAVLEEGEERPIGTSHVLCAMSGERVAALTHGEGVRSSARDHWPQLTVEHNRFVVSLLVARDGVPRELATESFIVPSRHGRQNPRLPTVHLQRGSRAEDPVQLLIAETRLPARGPLSLLEAREAVLSSVKKVLRFLDRHLVAVDSPHDGLPLWRYVDQVRKPIERVHIRESQVRPEPMLAQYSVDPPQYLGLAGEPLRGPIPGTYLVGRTVLPGLGQEGELLAATSVVKLLSQHHGHRHRMRHKMWSRIETS